MPSANRPATSMDVAQRAGVSRATVSYVLNDTPGVSFTEETREAVRRAATELNYRPNLMARSLVSRKGAVVFAMPALPQNEVTSTILGVVTRELFRRGYLATVVQLFDDVEAAMRIILGFQPRAVVFISDTWDEVVTRLEAESVPVILPGQVPASLGDYSIGALQVAHLVSKGHSRLAFAAAAESSQLGAPPRQAEVAAACSRHGLPQPLVAVVERDGTGAAETIRAWHEAGVTGVCAFNDEVALAVLHGIRAEGLRCPEDMAVVGCDNLPAGAVAAPPLTTVAFEPESATQILVWAILRQLEDAAEPPQLYTTILRIEQRATT